MMRTIQEAHLENAIRSLQSAFAVLATRCGYDASANTFATPDATLCGAIQDLYSACEAIYAAHGIDAIDLDSRPDLRLDWKFVRSAG